MFSTFIITISNDTLTLSKSDLLAIQKDNNGKEILGQILDPNNPYQGELDSNRVSHVVKNITYNNLTQALTAEIECLPTVYGLHLYKCFKNNVDSLVFHPVYCQNQVVTVNIEIKQNEKI